MKKLLVLLGVVCLFLSGPAAEAKKRSATAARKPTTKTATAAKKAPASSKKTTASRTVRTARGRRGRSTAAPAGARTRQVATSAPRRSGQSAPTSDRYKEIQQALQAKGYYNGPVDGQWTSDSVSALQKFQQDQNLKPDGKLDSLSLIALGLGPKHELAAQTRTTPQ